MKKAVLIIICYFISIFISNFVAAKELKVRWFDGVIPGGNIAHGGLACESSRAETALNGDRTENPEDVAWSNDGLTVFTVNSSNDDSMASHLLSMNKVAEPFKVTSDLMNSGGGDVTCDAIDGENPLGNSFAVTGSAQVDDELQNIVIKDDGKIFVSKNLFVKHLGHKGSVAADPRYEKDSAFLRSWHWMWSSFYYYEKNFSYFYAIKCMYGKFLRSLIKMIYYRIFYNSIKFKMYYGRVCGIWNRLLGKKSWYRLKIN